MFAGFVVFALLVLASIRCPQLRFEGLFMGSGILEFTYANITTILASDFVESVLIQFHQDNKQISGHIV